MRRRFDHENLKVYQSAVALCAWVTPILEALPSRIAARDQLDRASTSIVLNLAEGNGKRTFPDRCRFFDIARGSTLECAACLDVLVARGLLTLELAEEGKQQLIEVVSMIGGLLARYSGEGRLAEEAASYAGEKDKDKE